MSLVMVASQEQRFTALCGDELEPNSLYSLTPVNFCILERIGRLVEFTLSLRENLLVGTGNSLL